MADSRPEPGPLTRTSISLMPCDIACRAASCATCWAAKAVLLREPLNPTRPALDQPSTLPCMSVMVTLVLLKVARMLAIPTVMFLAPLALMILRALASSPSNSAAVGAETAATKPTTGAAPGAPGAPGAAGAAAGLSLASPGAAAALSLPSAGASAPVDFLGGWEPLGAWPSGLPSFLGAGF